MYEMRSIQRPTEGYNASFGAFEDGLIPSTHKPVSIAENPSAFDKYRTLEQAEKVSADGESINPGVSFT